MQSLAIAKRREPAEFWGRFRSRSPRLFPGCGRTSPISLLFSCIHEEWAQRINDPEPAHVGAGTAITQLIIRNALWGERHRTEDRMIVEGQKHATRSRRSWIDRAQMVSSGSHTIVRALVSKRRSNNLTANRASPSPQMIWRGRIDHSIKSCSCCGSTARHISVGRLSSIELCVQICA